MSYTYPHTHARTHTHTQTHTHTHTPARACALSLSLSSLSLPPSRIHTYTQPFFLSLPLCLSLFPFFVVHINQHNNDNFNLIRETHVVNVRWNDGQFIELVVVTWALSTITGQSTQDQRMHPSNMTVQCSKTSQQNKTMFVSWCFEPRQPQRITSGLDTTIKYYTTIGHASGTGHYSKIGLSSAARIGHSSATENVVSKTTLSSIL